MSLPSLVTTRHLSTTLSEGEYTQRRIDLALVPLLFVAEGDLSGSVEGIGDEGVLKHRIEGHANLFVTRSD